MAGKRALVLATNFSGVGGVERYTRNVAQALGEILGADAVDVFSLFGENNVGWAASPSQMWQTGSLPYSYLGSAGRMLNLSTKARFVLKSFRLALRGKYGLVICGHVSLAPIGYLGRVTLGLPYVVIGYGTDVWNNLTFLEKLGLDNARCLISLSRFTKEMLRTNHNPKSEIRILYPSVDQFLFAERRSASGIHARAEGPILMTVARLSSVERHKGCDTVIKALATIQKRIPTIKYCIVGEGDDRLRLEQIAEEQCVRDRVVFVGNKMGRELAEMYQQCDIYVMLSKFEKRNDREWMGEGFGIACIEAAAFGKPVLTSSAGGTRETIVDGSTGFLIDPEDTKALVNKVIELCENEGLRNQMGHAGTKWVEENHSPARFRTELKEIIDSFLDA